jgi:hypothetical protein
MAHHLEGHLPRSSCAHQDVRGIEQDQQHSTALLYAVLTALGCCQFTYR